MLFLCKKVALFLKIWVEFTLRMYVFMYIYMYMCVCACYVLHVCCV